MTTKDLEMDYTHKTYKNGLNVFLVNLPDAQSVLFTIMVKVGSRYETIDVTGISHFLEHLFFKGSTAYPNPTDISQLVDAIGGDFNASTSKEITEYYIKAEKHHFELIFDVLSDMVLNPLFNETEIEKEKGVVLEEINLYQDNPGAQVEANLEKTMWPGSPLGWEILGTKESIKKMTRQEIFAYKEKYYQPSNIVLGISGNFDTDKALDKIKKTWASLPSAKTPVYKPVTEKQNQPYLDIDFKKTQQAHLALGFKSFEHDNKKNVAVFLLSNILGGSMSSRLFVTIREQKGLAYYLSASNSPYFNVGNFTIHAGLQIDKANEALVEILAELRKIKSDRVSEIELRRAKDYVKGKMALAQEETHRRLDWVMDHFAFSGKIKTLEEFYKRLEAVTAEDIQMVANEIFQNNKMSLSIIGPFKNKKEFTKELHLKENF
ncbi:MAG: pitrilysin family protein [Candidatus Doudnabacteria bacterium]